MNILITGVGGMVGSHLAEFCIKNNHNVIGTYYKPTVSLSDIPVGTRLLECDVRYFRSLHGVIDSFQPEIIFHLAAQSYPTVSLIRPEETMEINAGGTIRLFEAIKTVRRHDSDYNPRVVVACSSAEYGASLTPENTPVCEDMPLLPLHPYGVSKVAQDLLTYQYYVSDGLQGIRARIFNTTGPRKVNDVCADFTKRIVDIERGDAVHLRVGNLETVRAITDVRDLVIALYLLAEKGVAGDVYNISGEYAYKISEIVELLHACTRVSFDVVTDPALLRPTDEPVIYGDSSKLKQVTGWKQQYNLETTIHDMLEYWRNKA